jgi:hypothetical protein
VGEDCTPFDIAEAQPQLGQYSISWRWVNRDSFCRFSHMATGLDHWRRSFDSDFILMVDSDMIVTGDFFDVVTQFTHERSIAGVSDTFPPWLARNHGDVERERSHELFTLAGFGAPVFDCPHKGQGVYYLAVAGMAKGARLLQRRVCSGDRGRDACDCRNYRIRL